MKVATLELFNAVPAKTGGDYIVLPEYGVIIEPSASYAKNTILSFLHAKKMSGTELNATFHKSWAKIENSSRAELLVHQILHYLTTYGTGHTSSFVYVPNEELNVPANLTFTVIRGWTREQFVEATLNMLKSGVAMKSDTIDSVIGILNDFDYKFTGAESVKNKEALMFLCQRFNAVPKDPVEFVRYLIFLATGTTLLIKSKSLYRSLELMPYENKKAVIAALHDADTEVLASVFNRFKPIFLSLKKSLGSAVRSKINAISKASKTEHVPMSYNVLNNIGSCTMAELTAQRDNLLNANFFQLARCIQFLKQNMSATEKVYQIRNGKTFAKSGKTLNKFAATEKMLFLIRILVEKYPLNGLKVYIPDDVFYALPTSEKLYVGNVPFGSKFVSDNVALGVFWRNEGGARDIDLSAISADSKVGWNSYYNDGEVLYSGDMTNASPCATEYLYSKKTLQSDYLVTANIFSGNPTGSKFNIIVGKGGNINKDYMMDPNAVWVTSATESIKREGLVGLITRDGNKNAAIVFHLGFGRSQVSYGGGKADLMRSALVQRWKNCFYLNELLPYLGAEMVKDSADADVDLSPNKLTRDSFTMLFSEKDK